MLIAGFAMLIYGANLLISGSSSLAKRYRVSELTIGLTIVAFGTSAPELIVNVVASVNRLNDMVIANVVGSNIFNLLLILGLSGAIYPISVQAKTVWKEIPYSVIAAIVLLLLANNFFLSDNTILSRLDGTLLLFMFALFMIYIFRNLKEKQNEITDTKVYSVRVSCLLILAGLTGLFFGGRIVVIKSVEIAHLMSMSEKLVGLTIVSAGTSLPELATSAVAAYKKKSDLAIGNVVGSNIFNIFLILGISAIIHPFNYSRSFNIDLLVLILASAILFAAMFTLRRKKLDRAEAILLLLAFIIYTFVIILRN